MSLPAYMYELNNKVRLINVVDYPITNCDEFLGFIMIMHIFVDWGNTGHNMAESLGITTVLTTKAHERNRDKCKRVGRNP